MKGSSGTMFREKVFCEFPGVAEGLRVIRSVPLSDGETDLVLKYHFKQQEAYVVRDLQEKFQIEPLTNRDWHSLRYEWESCKGRHDLEWSAEAPYREVGVMLKTRRHRSGRNKTKKQREFGKVVGS
jgi:hypothetical protein